MATSPSLMHHWVRHQRYSCNTDGAARGSVSYRLSGACSIFYGDVRLILFRLYPGRHWYHCVRNPDFLRRQPLVDLLALHFRFVLGKDGKHTTRFCTRHVQNASLLLPRLAYPVPSGKPHLSSTFAYHLAGLTMSKSVSCTRQKFIFSSP